MKLAFRTVPRRFERAWKWTYGSEKREIMPGGVDGLKLAAAVRDR
jgi:hypothetical protein